MSRGAQSKRVRVAVQMSKMDNRVSRVRHPISDKLNREKTVSRGAQSKRVRAATQMSEERRFVSEPPLR